MRKAILTSGVYIFIITALFGQQRIDGSFPFQTDPAKKYSLYIPSSYSPSNSHSMMLALHPFNTSRWDGKSWCDTLKVFAEANSLILVSPDGGVDGKINDPIDTAFTTALLDSVFKWYNVDQQRKYIMGFSWGGLTTYTYGLYHSSKFCGFMPIGAAVNGTTEVTWLFQNSTGKPFYIIHGTLDSPNTRFYPIKDSLVNRNAKVKFNLLSGIGHTIDFPNRNQILSNAYKWIDSVGCSSLTNTTNMPYPENSYSILPNVLNYGENLNIISKSKEIESSTIAIFDITGSKKIHLNIQFIEGRCSINTSELQLPSGLYFVTITSNNNTQTAKLVVQ